MNPIDLFALTRELAETRAEFKFAIAILIGNCVGAFVPAGQKGALLFIGSVPFSAKGILQKYKSMGYQVFVAMTAEDMKRKLEGAL